MDRVMRSASKLITILIIILLLVHLGPYSIGSTSDSSDTQVEQSSNSSVFYEYSPQVDIERTKRVLKAYYDGDLEACIELGIDTFWQYPDDTTSIVFALSCLKRTGKLLERSRDIEDKLFNKQINPQLAHVFLGFSSLVEYLATDQEAYLKDAKDEFMASLEGTETYASTFTGLGIVYYLQKLDTKALWNLERSYKLNPQDPITVEYLAKVYRRLDSASKAEDILRRLLQRVEYPDGYLLLGIIEFESSEYEKAETDFLTAVKLAGADKDIKLIGLIRASDCAQKRGDNEKAINYLQQALQLDPKNSWIKYKLEKLSGSDQNGS